MATRVERVRLDLEDRFLSGIIADTAAVAALKRELNSLSGQATRTSRSVTDVEKSVGRTSASSRRGAADIDRYSGRVRLLGEVLLALGPAAAPITALAIPAVTGLAAQLGAMALAGGTAVVAFQGVGDALDALRKAHLDPTTANLEAASQAMQQIGPHARQFARELVAMGPALREVRDAAAAGLFPGLTESLDNLDRLLPRAASLFEAVGAAAGDMAERATDSLAGAKWAPFFEFLEDEAPRTLSELGQILGDVAHGFAELWIAFTPLNRDFSRWLLDSADAFDRWATGLSQTNGFQEFVDYIRENGPRVADALGSVGNALVQIAEAAAPIGGPVLAAISGIADAVAVLAGSNVGAPLLALAAGMAAVSRATKIFGPGIGSLSEAFLDLRTSPNKAATAVERFGRAAKLAAGGAGIGLFAHSLTQTDDSMKLLESTAGGLLAGLSVGGGWGAAVGGVAGLLAGLGSASEESASRVDALTDSLIASKGAMDDAFRQLVIDPLESSGALKSAEKLGLDLNTVTDAALGNKDALAAVTAELDRFTASYTGANAGALRDSGVKQLSEDVATVRDAISGANGEVDASVGKYRRYSEAMGDTGGAAREAAGGVQTFEEQVASLNRAMEMLSGWLDHREAVRAYGDALGALRKGLKDGFGEKDAENLDAYARTIEQVFSTLEGKPLAQQSVIKDAIKTLRELATDAGPRAKDEIGELIQQLQKAARINITPEFNAAQLERKAEIAARRLDALNELRVNPKADLDDKGFQRKFGLTKADLAWLDTAEAQAYLDADPSGVYRGIGLARAALNSFDGTTATTYIATVHTPGHGADGAMVPKTGRPYADRHPYLLADGEQVTSNRRGQADNFRPELIDINDGYSRAAVFNRMLARGLADGGTAGSSHGGGQPGGGINPFGVELTNEVGQRHRRAMEGVIDVLQREREARLRELRERLRDAQRATEIARKQLDAARAFRDGVQQTFDSIADSISARFRPGGGLIDEIVQQQLDAIDRNLKVQLEEIDKFAELAGLTEGERQAKINQAQADAQAARDQVSAKNKVGLTDLINQFVNLENEGNLFQLMEMRLKALGVDGAALQYLLDNFNGQQLQAFVNEGADKLKQFEDQFNVTDAQGLQTGEQAAQAVAGQQLAAAQALLAEARERAKDARQHEKRVEDAFESLQEQARKEIEATKDVGEDVARSLSGHVMKSKR